MGGYKQMSYEQSNNTDAYTQAEEILKHIISTTSNFGFRILGDARSLIAPANPKDNIKKILDFCKLQLDESHFDMLAITISKFWFRIRIATGTFSGHLWENYCGGIEFYKRIYEFNPNTREDAINFIEEFFKSSKNYAITEDKFKCNLSKVTDRYRVVFLYKCNSYDTSNVIVATEDNIYLLVDKETGEYNVIKNADKLAKIDAYRYTYKIYDVDNACIICEPRGEIDDELLYIAIRQYVWSSKNLSYNFCGSEHMSADSTVSENSADSVDSKSENVSHPNDIQSGANVKNGFNSDIRSSKTPSYEKTGYAHTSANAMHMDGIVDIAKQSLNTSTANNTAESENSDWSAESKSSDLATESNTAKNVERSNQAVVADSAFQTKNSLKSREADSLTDIGLEKAIQNILSDENRLRVIYEAVDTKKLEDKRKYIPVDYENTTGKGMTLSIYPDELIEEAETKLNKSHRLMILGGTGSGKTRLSYLLAEKLTGEKIGPPAKGSGECCCYHNICEVGARAADKLRNRDKTGALDKFIRHIEDGDKDQKYVFICNEIQATDLGYLIGNELWENFSTPGVYEGLPENLFIIFTACENRDFFLDSQVKERVDNVTIGYISRDNDETEKKIIDAFKDKVANIDKIIDIIEKINDTEEYSVINIRTLMRILSDGEFNTESIDVDIYENNKKQINELKALADEIKDMKQEDK